MCFLIQLRLQAFCEDDNTLYCLCRLPMAQINTGTVSHIRQWYLKPQQNMWGRAHKKLVFDTSHLKVCWNIPSMMQVFSSCPVSLILLFSHIHLITYWCIEEGIWTLHTNCVCVCMSVFEHGQVQHCERRSHGKTVYCDAWKKELEWKQFCEWQEQWSLISCRANDQGRVPAWIHYCLENAEDNIALCEWDWYSLSHLLKSPF